MSANNKGSGEIVFMHRPEPLLVAYVIRTLFSCAGPHGDIDVGVFCIKGLTFHVSVKSLAFHVNCRKDD